MLRECTNETAELTVKSFLEWDAHLALKNRCIILTNNASHFANSIVESRTYHEEGNTRNMIYNLYTSVLMNDFSCR